MGLTTGAERRTLPIAVKLNKEELAHLDHLTNKLHLRGRSDTLRMLIGSVEIAEAAQVKPGKIRVRSEGWEVQD